MTALERIDQDHDAVKQSMSWLMHQNDVMEDESFAVTPGVVRRWETALRAVLTQHAPEPVPDPEWQGADWCAGCGHAWPCPTVRSLTEALEDES